MKRVYLLNAAFAMVILDLILRVHLASYVMRSIKQVKYTIFFGCFDLSWSVLGTVVWDSHHIRFALSSIPYLLPISINLFNMPCTTVFSLVISTKSLKINSANYFSVHHSGHTIWRVGLRPLASWDCGFDIAGSLEVCPLWMLYFIT